MRRIPRVRHSVPLLLCTQCASTSEGPTWRAVEELPGVEAVVETESFHAYEDAPRAPDADDPAIWVDHGDPRRSLIIGTLKDDGLVVFDLDGIVVQAIAPPNRPPISTADPVVPGPFPDPGTSACPDSDSGETYGRFNNVDVHQGLRLGRGHGARRIDVAVVTDRGCDRLRVFEIDRGRPGGPLHEITSPDAPRVFPTRFVQPSATQPSGEVPGVYENPLDDQSTAYGLALHEDEGGSLQAFVTQRSRSVVGQFELVPEQDGTVSYRKVRELRFPVAFEIGRGHHRRSWTACREDPTEDLQFEGLVVDHDRRILYAGQEAIGVWVVALDRRLPAVVEVEHKALVERTIEFGAPYWAVPDDEEFECVISPSGEPPPDAIVVAGDPRAGGRHLAADVEGLAIRYGERRRGHLVVSSQGDDTFHVFDRAHFPRHLGAFTIDGTVETDGHEVVATSLGARFARGLLVTQNGGAPGPGSEDPINGFSYDNSTQFKLVDWRSIAIEVGLE